MAIIDIRRGRVLLGRQKNAHGDGCWQFPGGHLEYGESVLRYAIKRFDKPRRQAYLQPAIQSIESTEG